MATYIKPEAIKNGTLTVGKLDTDIQRIISENTTGYELIEEITLEEDVTVFIRNVEPDGTPYDFRRMLVIITKGDKSAFGNSFGNYFLFQNRVVYPFLSIMANQREADICSLEVTTNNGKWCMKGLYKNSNGVMKGTFEMQDYIPITASTERIKQYRCTLGTPLPAGSKITIYGIR